MLGHDDDQLIHLAMADLRDMMDIHGEPEFARVIRHSKGLPQYHLGHQQRLATIDAQLRLLPGLYLSGNYLDGVSVRDCIARGKRMAERILRDGNISQFGDGNSPLHVAERTIKATHVRMGGS